MRIDVRTLTPGHDLQVHISDIVRLRLRVFRDWPYLYDGTEADETAYLSTLAASPGAVCIAAFDGQNMVGASTGMPLQNEHEPFLKPFRDAGYDITSIFYCAESVLLPVYRGRGLYRDFFNGREAHAVSLGGFKHSVFCGVIRPDDHPMKPEQFQPLDPVWQHFGYAPYPSLTAPFNWRDLGDAEETPKQLQFWGNAL